jgi:hypothetical protein
MKAVLLNYLKLKIKEIGVYLLCMWMASFDISIIPQLLTIFIFYCEFKFSYDLMVKIKKVLVVAFTPGSDRMANTVKSIIREFQDLIQGIEGEF